MDRLRRIRTAKRAVFAAILIFFASPGCTSLSPSGLSAVRPTPWKAPALAATILPEIPFPTPVPTIPVPATPTAIQPTPTHSSGNFQPTSVAGASFGKDTSPICQPGWCAYPGHFSLTRPIVDGRWDNVDPTYRYGSTQEKTRDPHTGVEFPAPESTPVYAAADGKVLVAAGDAAAHQVAGNEGYGNVVILEHRLPGSSETVYTLYAHLSEIDVKPGQPVRVGEVIARVGDTGAATGPHLHFEVRLGAPTDDHTRNPELWLAPHSTHGELNGALVARIQDTNGEPLTGEDVVLQSTGSAPMEQGGTLEGAIYQQTYADALLYPDNQYHENYAVGDLAPGWYRISFLVNGALVEQAAQVFPGQVTVVTFQ